MADVRSALLSHLRSPDDSTHAALQRAVEAGGRDLATATQIVRDDSSDADAAATVLAHLLVEQYGNSDADKTGVVDRAKALAQRAPREDEGNGVALLAGEVLWRLAGQPRLAEPFYRRVRRAEPANEQVVDFYRDLFAAAADGSQLMQVLVQARRAITDVDRRFALAEEMAQLAQERLGSTDRAIEVWRSVVREDGSDPRAVANLERLYREGKKWTALVELLKDEFDRLPDDETNRPKRIGLLLEITDLYRKELKLEAMALSTLQRILEIEPRHQGSLEVLADTYAAGKRWNDLLGVYQRLRDSAKEDGDRESEAKVLRKVAAIWVDNLGNPQRALEPLGELLELIPGDAEAREMIAKIHEQRKDWRALILLRREELADREGDAALELRLVLARLAEDKLGDRREAIASWNAVLEHHGENDKALEALARLYERESRWAEAAEIRHRQVAGADSVGRAVRLLTDIGHIYSERLRNQRDAIRVWQEIARLVPGHDKALRTLRDAYVAAAMWDDLTALYVAQGRVSDLVDALQSAADRVSVTDERVDLYRRVAHLCREKLGQPERAVKALERTLAIQPDNLVVARELLPIYREQSNWAALMRTLSVLLKASPDIDGKLEMIEQLREVASDKLQSPQLTFGWAARAYELRSDDASLRARLEKAAADSDNWDELTRIFERRMSGDAAAASGEPAGAESEGDAVPMAKAERDEQLLLLGKLAAIARDHLSKPDDAQRYFRRIVELDPTNEGAMSSLENIYTATRRWDDLSEVYRRRLAVATDDNARLSTLRGLARLQEEHLRDLDAAVQTYDRILELATEDLPALESLATILRSRGEWQRLAEVLQRKLELPVPASGERTIGVADIPVLFELSHIQMGRLGQTATAVGGFLQILELDSAHRTSVAALEEIHRGDPSTSVTIMRGLLPFYRRIGDKVREAEAMEVLLAAPDPTGNLREQRGQLAAIYEQMPDRRHQALDIYASLFVDDPGDWERRQLLQKLGRSLGGMERVASAYQQVLANMAARVAAAEGEGRTIERAESNLRRDLLLELGGIQRDDLQQASGAEATYREILERDETHQAAYEALEALLRARQAPADLMALYRRRVDVVFNQREQRELLGRIIEIARTILGDRETAVRTAEELLDLIPDEVPTIELLAQMYAEGGRDGEVDKLDKLEELLGRWAELVSDRDHRHELTCKRAALRMQLQGDAFGAVDLLGTVIGENGEHERARLLLEELLDHSDVQMQVASLLEPIYQRVGHHDGRIRILHVRRNNAADEGRRDDATAYLLDIARIEEQELADAERAFASLREAYLGDPRRLDSRREVERLGALLHRERDLVEVWGTALRSEEAQDKTLRIDLIHRMAVLLDDRLRDAEGARRAWLALLELDPPDADLAHKTVRALVRLHLEAGDFAALAEAERALLRFTDAHHEQVRIRLEIARIQLEQLMDRIGAALTWAEVVDMEPANRIALDALEQLLLEEREWQRLTEVLQHRIGVADDPRVQVALWRRIGEIRRTELGEPQRAIEAYQSILDLKTGHDDAQFALTQLVELNRVLERWSDVEEGLRRLILLAERDTERVRLLCDTAEIVGSRLGRADDALDLLKRVLDTSPVDDRARRLVAGYLESDDTRERAIRILAPLFEAEQNWSALLELQELQARKQPSGRRRLQALLRVAKTQEEKLADPARAFAVLCEAMTEAGDQPELVEILDKLERLGAASERSEGLWEAYARTVDHILDADSQQRVLRSMGEVALVRLGRHDEARRVYERLLENRPDDDPATDALEQIYVAQSDNRALAQLLVRKVDRISQAATRDTLLIRAGEIHRTALAEPDEAIRLYERLSDAGLARPQVPEVLEELYESTGRFRELAAHLTRKLGQLSGHAAVDTHLRLGRLYGSRLDDPEEGIRHLGAALKADPDRAVGTDELSRYLQDPAMRSRAAQMLEPVFMAVQDWDRLLQIQEVRLAEAQDHAERVMIMLRMARMQEEQVEDLERAFEAYARVFKEDPANTRVRDHLSRLANVLATTDRYAEILTEHVDAHAEENTDSNLEIIHEAAKLWAGSLRQPAKAAKLYERLLEARPDDRTVFTELEGALTMGGMWQELADAYWREAEDSMDDARQVDLLTRLSRVALDVLDDRPLGARAFERILELQPDNDRARSQLEQVLHQTERWPDLLDRLRDRLARSVDQDARTPVQLQIAELQDGPLEDPEGALDTLEGLLAESPNEPNAVATLERIAERRVAQRPRIFNILQPTYEATGNTQRLVSVCEWRLTVSEDPGTRHELHRELARHLEGIPDGGQYAFRALARGLFEPGPAESLALLDAEIERLATARGMPTALADALVAASSGELLATDVDRRLDLLIRAARLRAGAPDVAVTILRDALALQSDHIDALALIDEALVQLGSHDELRAVLHRRVEVETDDVVRLELLRRLARLYDDILGNAAEAEVTWRKLLDIEPADTEALERLSRTYAASGSTRELINVLERRIDSSNEPDERRTLRMQLAGIHRSAQDRVAEIDVLRALLGEAPNDDTAMAVLTTALLADQRHADAADVLQERASIAASRDQRAGLLLEAARLYAGPLADLLGALERYEQVLQAVPGHDGAVTDLVGLAQREDVSEHASGLVRPHLEQLGRWADLASVIAGRASFAQDPEEAIRSLRELASVRHEKLGDVVGALEATLRLVDAVAADELAEPLNMAMRLAGQLDRLDGLVTELGRRSADSEREPEARLIIATAAADAASSLLGDPDKALGVLVPLLDAELASFETCRRIEELALRKGDTTLVERALDAGVKLAVGQAEPAEQVAALVRLGEARITLGELSSAVTAFREVLDLDTSSAPALAGLERCLEACLERDPAGELPEGLLDALDAAYQARHDTGGLARVVRVRLRNSRDSDRIAQLQSLGTLLDGGGGTPSEALDAWGALLAVDIDAAQALDRLLALAAQPELSSRAGELLASAIETGAGAGRLNPAACLACAHLWLDRLGVPERAGAALRPLLDDQPEHPEALGLLVGITRALGEPKPLHDALRRSAAAQSDPAQAAALWRDAATVAETSLDVSTAIDDLTQLLDADESDRDGWDRLLALRGRSTDHEAFAEALSRRVMITDDSVERRALRHRLANHLVTTLDRKDDAIGVYNDMIGANPDDLDAYVELEGLLRGLERWQDVRDLLERKLEAVHTIPARVEIQVEMAELAEERLGDSTDAIEILQRILIDEPDPAIRAWLERLLTQEGRWPDLAELLEGRMDQAREAGDTDAFRDLASELAALLAEKLDDGDRAQGILASLLEVDPSYVPAILSLASVYESRGDEGAMRLTLQRAVELDPRGSLGARVQMRLSRLAGDDSAAKRAHLEKALQLDPGNLEAGSVLLEQSRAEKRWDRVAELLQAASERTEDADERRKFALERVDILTHELHDSAAALEELAVIYGEVNDDIEINRRIADALYVADRGEEAAGMYNWLVEISVGKRDKLRAHYLTRLAQIEIAMGTPDEAQRRLEEAYRLDSTNAETLVALGGVHEANKKWGEALKIYRSMLLQNADKSGALRRGDIYLSLARTHLGLSEKSKAQAMLRRGVEEDPDHAELKAMLAEVGG